MKGGIAAMAFAIHTLQEIGFEPSGRAISVSVPDEETSGPRGTVALAETGLIERDALGMLTMEPTGGVIWNGNRGVITLRITVHGRPAHVGMHFRGVNAFQGMLDVAAEFAALGREVAERRTDLNIRPDAAQRSVLLLGGELSGGHLFNAVPDRVSFTVDRRTNPEENFDAERERLLAIVTRACERGLNVTVEQLQQGRPSATSARVPLARALATSVRAVTGKPARFELCPGVLETRHYAALGVPALAYGPGLLSISHGPNEFVAIGKLIDCAEVYARTAIRLLS
jgi:acetylornithine deacetylase/succinyl-diaminopimelate desuccinylase-like protein